MIKTVAILIGFLGISYLISKIVSHRGTDLDFQYLWLAGRLWADGITPYSVEYQEAGQSLFARFNGQPLYYPPNWWIVTRLFALFEHEVALELWRVFNGTIIIFSSYMLYGAFRECDEQLEPYFVLFYTGLLSVMQITIIIIFVGQTSLLLYLGIVLIICGTLTSKNWLLITGFCIILLKPQVGVPLFFAFIMFKKYHSPAIWAGLITFVLSLPPLILNGPINTLKLYLNGLSVHSTYLVNSPAHSTGLKNIMVTVFNISVPSLIISVVSIFVMILTILYFKKAIPQKELNFEDKLVFLMLSIIAIAFVAPLHEYDLVFIAPIMLLSVKLPLIHKVVIFSCMIITARIGNIANIFGFTLDEDVRTFNSVIYTIVLSMIFVTILTALNSRKKKNKVIF